MTGFWSPLVGAFATFFAVWGRSLRQALPEKLGERLRFERNCTDFHAGGPEDIEHAQRATDTDVRLILDHKATVTHSCHMPRAALREIERAVAVEASRAMPLKTSELIISHAVSSKTNTNNVAVTIVAARKNFVYQLLTACKDKKMTISAIAVESETGLIPLHIPYLRRQRVWRTSSICLAALTLLLLLSQIPAMYLSSLQRDLIEVDDAIQVAQKNTAQIARLQRQMRSMRGLSEAVRNAKNEAQILELLSILTDSSPDDVVINRFNLTGERLSLTGRSRSPEEWVLKLQQLPVFGSVRLTSVRAFGGGETKDFDLICLINWPEEGQG